MQLKSSNISHRAMDIVQSTLVILKSQGLYEIFRDIRTLTHQICKTEEKISQTTKFHK